MSTGDGTAGSAAVPTGSKNCPACYLLCTLIDIDGDNYCPTCGRHWRALDAYRWCYVWPQKDVKPC